MVRQLSRRRKGSLMIDPGVYPAWRQGGKIDVEQYVDYCLNNLEDLDYIIVPHDVPNILSRHDRRRADFEPNAAQSWENIQYALRRGIPQSKIITTHRFGERMKWLLQKVEMSYYVALWTGNYLTQDERRSWLDACMRYVCDDKGMPVVKFHGVEIKSDLLLSRYPWYSVDCTSWQKRKDGSVYPREDNQSKCYLGNNPDWRWPFKFPPAKPFSIREPETGDRLEKLKGREFEEERPKIYKPTRTDQVVPRVALKDLKDEGDCLIWYIYL